MFQQLSWIERSPPKGKAGGSIPLWNTKLFQRINMEEKEKYMKEALKEAKKAYSKLEIPVGAVIVKNR